MNRNLAAAAQLNYLLEKLRERYEVQVNKTFWLSASVFFKADIIAKNTAICLTFDRVSTIKKRAIKYLGYHCLSLSVYELNEELINKAVEVVSRLGPLSPKVKPISPRERPEKIDEGLEEKIVEAAYRTSKLSTELLSPESFLKVVEETAPGLSKFHSAMDKLVLTDVGFSLKKKSEGVVDFKDAAERLCKLREFMGALFSEGKVTVSNLFTLTSPNFMKNLLLIGGPRVKPNLIKIKSYDEFLENVQSFSEEMQACEVYLDLRDLKEEICSQKNRKALISNHPWVNDLCSSLTA